jgi:lysozyme
MKISKNGLNIIKKFEGLELKPYLCPSKIPSIGYGNTYYRNNQKIKLTDDSITEEEANNLLEFIANKDFASCVNKYVKVELNQNQFDALVSFVYNVGNVNFKTSTLLKKINKYDFVGASNEFKKWKRSNGKILKGLVRRRKSERNLFKKEYIGV